MSMLKNILYLFNVYIQVLLSYLYTTFSQGSRPVINQHRIWAKHMVLIPKEEQFCNMEVTWQKHDHRLVIVKWSCSGAIVELVITLLCFQLDHNYFQVKWFNSKPFHLSNSLLELKPIYYGMKTQDTWELPNEVSALTSGQLWKQNSK